MEGLSVVFFAGDNRNYQNLGDDTTEVFYGAELHTLDRARAKKEKDHVRFPRWIAQFALCRSFLLPQFPPLRCGPPSRSRAEERKAA